MQVCFFEADFNSVHSGNHYIINTTTKCILNSDPALACKENDK